MRYFNRDEVTSDRPVINPIIAWQGKVSEGIYAPADGGDHRMLIVKNQASEVTMDTVVLLLQDGYMTPMSKNSSEPYHKTRERLLLEIS